MRYLLPLLTLGLGSTTLAQEPNRRIADALLEIHETGRSIYNNDGDYTGAYRIYQGGLMVARRMLADRADLQKVISDGMAAAERLPTVDRRAFRLHELIEAVRMELGKASSKGSDKLTIPPREVGPPTK